LGSLGEDNVWFTGSTKGSAESISFIVSLAWSSWGGVQAPLGLQWLLDLLWGAELEVTGLLGDHSTFVSRLQLGNKLGLEAAGLLWVQVTDLLWDVNKRSDGLVVALLWSLFSDTASSADLNWKLFTLGVSDKLARLLLNILGSTAGFVDSSALLRSLAVANLFQRLVALLDGFVNSLLFESNLA